MYQNVTCTLRKPLPKKNYLRKDKYCKNITMYLCRYLKDIISYPDINFIQTKDITE